MCCLSGIIAAKREPIATEFGKQKVRPNNTSHLWVDFWQDPRRAGSGPKKVTAVVDFPYDSITFTPRLSAWY